MEFNIHPLNRVSVSVHTPRYLMKWAYVAVPDLLCQSHNWASFRVNLVPYGRHNEQSYHHLLIILMVALLKLPPNTTTAAPPAAATALTSWKCFFWRSLFHLFRARWESTCTFGMGGASTGGLGVTGTGDLCTGGTGCSEAGTGGLEAGSGLEAGNGLEAGSGLEALSSSTSSLSVELPEDGSCS